MIQFDASGNRLSPAQVRQKHKGTTKSVIDPIKILNIYRTGPGPSKGGGRYDCEQFLGTRTRCKDRTGSILDDIEYIGRPANFGQVSAPRSKYFILRTLVVIQQILQQEINTQETKPLTIMKQIYMVIVQQQRQQIQFMMCQDQIQLKAN